MHRAEFQYEKQRGEQVYEDVMRRRPRDWIALDDSTEGWTPESAGHYIQTDPYEGIAEPQVLEALTARLALLSKREQQ